MKINDRIEISIDIEQYLRQKNISHDMVGNNAMMCCTFHKDSNPSFGINVITGLFHCFAGSCGVKGNVVQFIKQIENLSSYEEAELWLRIRFGNSPDEVDKSFNLDFYEKEKQEIIYVEEAILLKYDFRHPYLEGRGISGQWQNRFRIGYDKEHCSITIPWFDRFGRCLAIKERSVSGKSFRIINFNGKGPNSFTLFGMNHIYRKQIKRAVITEGEIDAIYCWQCGFPAVALGTSSITDAQVQELKNSYIDSVIIATDNDNAGRKIAGELNEVLTWIPDIRQVDWSMYQGVKDVNQLNKEELQKLINDSHWKFVMSGTNKNKN